MMLLRPHLVADCREKQLHFDQVGWECWGATEKLIEGGEERKTHFCFVDFMFLLIWIEITQPGIIWPGVF